MTERAKIKITEKVQEMSNGELLKFHMKFKKEKRFMSQEEIDFVQDVVDSREKELRKKARIS